MLSTTLNYLRFALLGIAMAFVINPFVYGSPRDNDEDGILNHEDVCMNESYSETFHEICLERAGVYFVGSYIDLRGLVLDLVTNPFMPPEIREWYRETIERLHKKNMSVIDTFPEAQIKTCYDLYEFAIHYHDDADFHEQVAEYMLELAGKVAKSRIPPRVKALIIGGLLLAVWDANRIANRYRKAAWAAEIAHIDLCSFRLDDPIWVG